MKYVDLTHAIVDGMSVYPGDSSPSVVQVANFEQQGFVRYQINTSMHVGTHIDAPLHMLEGGARISDFAPERFLGRGYLIDARGKSIIDVQLLEKSEIKAGDIVLVLTGFSEKFHDPVYYKSSPVLTENFAKKLIEFKIKMVGLDTSSPDNPPFTVHKLLLSHEILIIENLTNLSALVGVSRFDVIALPVKIDAEAAPARVVAQIL